MKIRALLFLSFFVALPAAASPDPQVAKAAGFVEGTLFTCARVNPASAAQYARQAGLLLAYAGHDVDESRGTTDYRQAFAKVTSDLSSAPKAQVVAACTGFLAARR